MSKGTPYVVKCIFFSFSPFCIRKKVTDEKYFKVFFIFVAHLYGFLHATFNVYCYFLHAVSIGIEIILFKYVYETKKIVKSKKKKCKKNTIDSSIQKRKKKCLDIQGYCL